MTSMSVENSQLSPDIEDIIANPKDEYKPIFNFETKLHTDEKDLDYTDGIVLIDIHIVRDYVNNISDYIEVKLSIPVGTFLYDVYDKLDNIEVTVITTKQLTKNGTPFTVKERYKAIYLLDKNTNIPNTIRQSKDDLNNQIPLIITFQLLDRSVETLRIKTTQGNFDQGINGNSDMGIVPFLKSIISEQSNKILIENKPSLDGIDIEEPDNKDKLKAITLPTNTRIIEIPEIIQEKNIGVYNGGLGCYIQKFGTDYFTYKKNLFIYSLFNDEKFKTADFKTIFFIPVTSSHSGGDNTYKYKDKIIRILPHSSNKIADNKETSVMSSGSGFRMSNANSYMKKPVTMTEDGPVFARTQLASEVIYKDRLDGLNFSPNKSVSNNQFKLTSDLLRKNGNYIKLEVSNFDHDFLFPAAKCKMLYEDKNNQITELYGVVHMAIISYSNPNPSPIMTQKSKTVSLTSHVSLQIFINSR